ncbi:hypothetical protein [Lentzea sp. NPDC059081]|uniref:hypothetical protein n=1 Tax=Lentzea sp. NPDC059081 TaxID=3346719 RepID=UPI003686EBCE
MIQPAPPVTYHHQGEQVHFNTCQLQIHAEHATGTGARNVHERLAPPMTIDATTSSATDYVVDCEPDCEAVIRQEAAEIWVDTQDPFTGKESVVGQARPSELRLIAERANGLQVVLHKPNAAGLDRRVTVPEREQVSSHVH